MTGCADVPSVLERMLRDSEIKKSVCILINRPE